MREIERGKSFEVTDRGQPVAVLAPLPRAATPLQKLIAAGRAAAPVGDLLDLGAPKGKASHAASGALAQERHERGAGRRSS